MKRAAAIIIFICIVVMNIPVTFAAEEKMPFDVNAESAVLMEASTGEILYAKNPDAALPPASVTKVMTLLLVMEAIDSGKMNLKDMIPVSEYAASMGGSQVFLEAGEEMTCEDMLKSVVISSANDAAVAFAEYVSGSEEAFVKRMNERALELGMKNTNFENATGLDDDTKNHVISAKDIAIMSRELITKHPAILKYSSIWMDSIRGGEFGLSNTNRLIRFYKGATGLKTGSTSKAGFCISATAEREGMHLIAVIMGSKTRDERNEAAKKLLDFGFSNYILFFCEEKEGKSVDVEKGDKQKVKTQIQPFSAIIEKSQQDKIKIKTEYKGKITAPVKKGSKVGKAEYYIGDKKLWESHIVATEDVGELGYADILLRLLKACFMK